MKTKKIKEKKIILGHNCCFLFLHKKAPGLKLVKYSFDV